MDSESSNDAKPSRGLVTWLIWFLVLVIVIGYPLSLGPVVAIYGLQTPKWIDSPYAPLIYACENVPAVRAFYDWYLPLCGVP